MPYITNTDDHQIELTVDNRAGGGGGGAHGFNTATVSGITLHERHREAVEHDLRRKVRKYRSPTNWSDIDLSYGKLLKYMDEPNIQAFFYEKAKEVGGPQEAQDAYRDGGLEGVREYVLNWASEGIGAEADMRDTSFTEAFNFVAEDWPHVAAALLARREYQEGRPDEGYMEDVETFARAEGFIDGSGEPTDAPLPEPPEHELADDPYEDVGSSVEANTIIACRNYLCEDPDERMLGGIDDHASFRSWLSETGDLQQAFNNHAFDVEVPDEIIDVAAHPNDWDEIDPANIPVQWCDVCSEAIYHIHHVDAGLTHYTQSGGPDDIHDVADPTGDVWFVSDAETICGACFARDVEHMSRDYTLAPSSSTGIDAVLAARMPAVTILGGSLGSLSPNQVELIRRIVTNGPEPSNPNTIVIRPSDEYGDSLAQIEYLERVAAGTLEPDFGGALTYIRGQPGDASTVECGVIVENDAERCIEVKDTLAGISSETNSTPGLGELFG